ncbi:MAG: hypothetical protein KGZ41_03415 [Dethiobacter sp.]|nr:hypothetical protein [Dethiobacter sp.]
MKPKTIRKVPPLCPSREPYWQREQPQRAVLGRAVLTYYRQEGVLQVAQRGASSDRKLTVTLDQADVQRNPAAGALLGQVVKDWQP